MCNAFDMQNKIDATINYFDTNELYNKYGTTNKLNTTCEVHHLAFHTWHFPHFPVLQFGAAFSNHSFFYRPTFSSLAFSVPPTSGKPFKKA